MRPFELPPQPPALWPYLLSYVMWNLAFRHAPHISRVVYFSCGENSPLFAPHPLWNVFNRVIRRVGHCWVIFSNTRFYRISWKSPPLSFRLSNYHHPLFLLNNLFWFLHWAPSQFISVYYMPVHAFWIRYRPSICFPPTTNSGELLRGASASSKSVSAPPPSPPHDPLPQSDPISRRWLVRAILRLRVWKAFS